MNSIKWSPEAISRFWNNYESSPGMEYWHFSRQRGKALLRFVRRHVAYADPILDLGCGSGHLLTLLLGNSRRCYAADVGSKGIELVQKRFKGMKKFLGARLMASADVVPYEDSSVSTVFLLETVEHLLPETLDGLMGEVARVLAPGGVAVITCPYREKLAESIVECGNCGCGFHKTQHLRSINEPAVSAMVKGVGLSVVFVGPALLLPDPLVWLRAQTAPSRVAVACPECGTRCESPNKSTFGRIKGLAGELKHMVCIARKSHKI